MKEFRFHAQTTVLIILTALFVCLNTFFTVWLGDDLCYRFITDTLQPVENWSDVMKSQYIHYFNINGRAPIHIVLQIFTGVLGRTAFAIANAIVFTIFSLLAYRLVDKKPLRYLPQHLWKYFIIVVALIMFFPFPDLLIYSISLSLNYIWAGTWAVAFLLAFKLIKEEQVSKISFVGMAVLAFFAGWQNEAFSVPLCGGILLYALIKRNLTRQQIILYFLLCLGACLVVFSPGTLSRASSHTQTGPSAILLSLYDCYSDIIFFWILVISLVATAIYKYSCLRKFVAENLLLFLILGVGCIFSIYAHTYAQSLFFIEFLSFVLTMRLLSPLIPYPGSSRISSALLWIAIVAFTGCGLMIVKANKATMRNFDDMQARFRADPFGVTWFEPSSTGMAFIDRCVPNFYSHLPIPSHYTAQMFSAWNGEMPKLPVVLTIEDYNLLNSLSTSESSQSTILGNTNLREGKQFYIEILPSDSSCKPAKFTAYFDDDSFMQTLPLQKRFIYRAFMHGRKEPQELEADTVDTRIGKVALVHKIASSPTRIEVSKQ